MPAKGRELKRIAETTSDITLKLFLEASGLELVDVYAGNHSWSDLLEAGGVLTLPSGPEELTLRRALGRLLHLDDSQRINQYRSFAQATQPPSIGAMDLRTRRLFHMLARSEEHTSELQSLMRISYAVFCLQKKHIHTHYSSLI